MSNMVSLVTCWNIEVSVVAINPLDDIFVILLVTSVVYQLIARVTASDIQN